MGKPWSKLKSRIVDLFDPKLKIDIHQSVYRMDSQRGSNDLPRYFMTLNKEIIFDYPKDFVSVEIQSKYKGVSKNEVQHLYPYVTQMGDISDLLRAYIDSPVKDILNKEFDDPFKITDILKASDRRMGKEKLTKWSESKSQKIKEIIQQRFS